MNPVEAALMAKARALGPRQKQLRLPPAPRPRVPLELERQYFQDLRKQVIQRLEAITRQALMPHLVSILEDARDELPGTPTLDSANATRRDAYTRAIDVIFNGMRVKLATELTEQEIGEIASRYANRGQDFNRGQIGGALQKVLAINPLVSEPYLVPVMRQFVDQNTQLIRSIGEDYFGKVQADTYKFIQAGVYNKEYAKQIRGEFAGEFQRQFEKGILKRRVENADARARLIARDQISKYNGQLNQTRQTALGLSKYRWVTSGDDRVRQSHIANNGKIFSWDSPPATGHPGEDYQCRCVAQPVFDTGVTDNPELLRLLNS